MSVSIVDNRALLQCCGLIRILRASLAQIDTEMAEKYAKLGKAAKFRSVYDIRERNPVPGIIIILDYNPERAQKLISSSM